MRRSILSSILVGLFFVHGCGGSGSSPKTVQLDGNVTITIDKINKQANTAEIHIVTDINEATYVFDNNKIIPMSRGTVHDGYIVIKSGKHYIKVCSDKPGTICSFEQGILVSHNVDANAYKKYTIESPSGALTNDGSKLVYGTNDGSIYTFDLDSNKSSLMYSEISSRLGGLAYFNENTYYYSLNRSATIGVVNVSTQTTKKIAKTTFPDGLDVFNKKIYSVTTDRSGELTIFDLEGKKTGTLSTSIPDITGITHTSKFLYILSEDGNIYQVDSTLGKSERIFTNDNLFTKGNNNQGLEAITILDNYIYVSYIDDIGIYKIDINVHDYE